MELPVDAGRDGPEESGYSVLLEVQHLLAGMDFDDVHAPADEPTDVTANRLRTLLVNVQGRAWQSCSIQMHTDSSGRRLFSASRLCMSCSARQGQQIVHTLIATPMSDGNFDFAAPEDE